MIGKTRYKIIIGLFVAAMSSVFAACSSEEVPAANSPEDGGIRVVAEVARQVYSRAYQEEGYVESGTYYLSYPSSSNGNPYGVAQVDFGRDEKNPAIGFIDPSLKWKDVGGGSTPTFYLDNVSDPERNEKTEVKFSDVYNPYKAGLFDKEGMNDLLWGKIEAQRNAKTINFDLHHNMSRLRVQVTVNKDQEYGSSLTLDGAKVEISSINQNPVSFNRLSGDLELPAVAEETEEEYKRVYTSLTLVDELENTKEEDRITWKEDKEENNESIVYTTQDFVLPPQGLLENEYRPRLTITLKDGTKYSGILPHAMEIEGEDNTTIPAYLYFLKEHILTIRTVITEEPPLLSFMPVWVMKWVDKGEFTIEAHQAGIYREEEFYKLIEYYRANNEYQLVRYGYLYTTGEPAEERWNFDFFSGVTLDRSRITGKMVADEKKEPRPNPKPFSFSFNNYAVYVGDKDENGIFQDPKRVTETELYNIVTGKSN